MHINYATFHNFGLFKHYEQAFTRGLVGIFGSNGSGKTTMVNGIFAALTNDFSRFVGVKTEQIHDMAEAKEESFIEVAAEHDSRQFYIRRSLRPNRSELKIHGEKAITNANAIEDRLQHDLGVNTQLIGRYVFVDQWQMFDFLNQKPSERADAYKRLCRTEKAGRIFDACSAMLTANQVDAEVVDNSDELASRIGQADEEMAKLNASRQKWEKRLLNEKSLKSGKALLRKRERHTEFLEELDRCEQREPKLRRLVSRRKKAAEKTAKGSRRANHDVTNLQGPAEAARMALKNWVAYEKRQKRRQALEADLEALSAEEAKHPEPKRPEDYDSKSRFARFLTRARTDRTRNLEVIRVFEQTQSGECPTCHQKIGDSHIAKLRRDIACCENTIKELRPKLEALEAYDQDCNRWAQWKSGWEARGKATRSELEGLKDLQEPTGHKETLQADVDAYVAAGERAEAARLQAKKDEEVYTETLRKLTALERHITKLGERITETQVPDAKIAKVQARMQEHEAAVYETATIDGQLREIKRRREDAARDLDALKATMQRRKKLRKAMEILGKARDVFHWSRLPWMVAQGNLICMEGDINEALHWFGDPFWVQADDKLSFRVHIPGRTPKRAEALSGGQKGVLAIAFRSGANAVFNVDLGMMFLDEPTAGLDDENVGYFEDALRALAAQVRGKRQLVIVTHANELRPAFDQVIQIKGSVA